MPNFFSNDVANAISYIPLVIIGLGLVGNTLSFLIFTFNEKMSKFSSMNFLAFVAVTDTLGLFTWNLNHYLYQNFGFKIEYVNMFTCKFFTFIQYASLQISGLLYSIISVDRYFTVISQPGSFASRLPFGTKKTAILWSFGIIILITLLNLHLIIFNGYYSTVTTNSTIVVTNNINGSLVNSSTVVTSSSTKLMCYKSLYYEVSPMWDQAQLVVYTFIPSAIMVIFNTLLIMQVLINRKGGISKYAPSHEKKKLKLTVSLIIITFTFILLTAPGTIGFGFFTPQLKSTTTMYAIGTVLDSMMFLQHSILFFVAFLTNTKFSQIVRMNAYKILGCYEQ